MDKIDKINKEIISIKDRISDIYKLFNIYNINDSDSINSVKEELKKYTDRLKAITNEEFK